jgi:hypothetical protein
VAAAGCGSDTICKAVVALAGATDDAVVGCGAIAVDDGTIDTTAPPPIQCADGTVCANGGVCVATPAADDVFECSCPRGFLSPSCGPPAPTVTVPENITLESGAVVGTLCATVEADSTVGGAFTFKLVADGADKGDNTQERGRHQRLRAARSSSHHSRRRETGAGDAEEDHSLFAINETTGEIVVRREVTDTDVGREVECTVEVTVMVGGLVNSTAASIPVVIVLASSDPAGDTLKSDGDAASSSNNTGLGIGIGLAVLVLLCLLCGFCWCCRKRRYGARLRPGFTLGMLLVPTPARFKRACA